MGFVAKYLVASSLVAALSLLEIYPWHPTTWIGWLILYSLALPVYMLGEYWSGRMLSEERALRISPNTTRVSIKRVLYALAMFLVTLTFVLGVGYLILSHLQGFVSHHFSRSW